MARCARCNKFMLLRAATNYCDSCNTQIILEARRQEAQLKAEGERKRREEAARKAAEEARKAAEEAQKAAEEERKREEEAARKEKEERERKEIKERAAALFREERQREYEEMVKRMHEEAKPYYKYLDIRCPICGNNRFLYAKLSSGERAKTVLWCRADRTAKTIGDICRGVACYCKGCDTYYPENMFGFRNGVYECKECGTPQWEYTDYKKRDDEMGRAVAKVTNWINNI